MDECLPRPNNQAPISIRKSAFGRTNLFLNGSTTLFREVKCSASSMTRQATASVYHMHDTNKLIESENELNKENIVCWHCCHKFAEEGFRLPRSYDPQEKTYHVYGWFCSANCCKAYILEHSTFDRGYQMNIFVRMLREVYGISSGIIESPPRISLKMFGGPFDIESFRTQKNVCTVVHPPFVSYCMLIEERQPIESIGETNTTQNMARGSVKGLRRPIEGGHLNHDEDFSSPAEDDALYMKFVDKQEKMDDEPPKKQPKLTEKKKNSEKGLARYMATTNK